MINVKDLTIKEKITLLAGRDHWHLDTLGGKLPEFTVTDGPNGVRHQEYVEKDGELERVTINDTTCMPSVAALASSWNPELAKEVGAAIADECILTHNDVLLAPGVNIKRTPVCGRNFEYFSEDPYLAGTLARSYIEGVQSKGIGTSLKHFAANNSEYDRYHQSSEVDERTFREIYTTAFEIALEAEPWTVMCSYNPVNGILAAENPYLLKTLLRDEFGFKGVIVSDWRAVRESARSIKAGLDLEMPYRKAAFEEIYAAYEAGYLTEDEIDRSASRILEMIEKVELTKDNRKVTTTPEERHAIAVRGVEEGAVLLKNEDNILPLKSGKILIAGMTMKRGPVGGGGGSSLVVSEYKQPKLADAIGALMGEGAEIIDDPTLYLSTKQVGANGTIMGAYSADTVVFFIGNDSAIEYEGANRKSLSLPKEAENTLVELTEVNENVVVVIHAGSAVDVSRFVNKVKAILYVPFGGEGVMEAVARILTGAVSPSGKLAETFPIALEDTPTANNKPSAFVDRYEEGIFVGYRYYEKMGKAVAFPFGHGLSYSSFEYSELALTKSGDGAIAEFTVTNTGDVCAKEVAEVYVRDVFAAVSRPVKELKGYEKLTLAPGESKRISVELPRRAFCYYSPILHDWYLEDGAFEIHVGSSSADIRLIGKIDMRTPKYEHYSSTVLGEGAK